MSGSECADSANSRETDLRYCQPGRYQRISYGPGGLKSRFGQAALPVFATRSLGARGSSEVGEEPISLGTPCTNAWRGFERDGPPPKSRSRDRSSIPTSGDCGGRRPKRRRAGPPGYSSLRYLNTTPPPRENRGLGFHILPTGSVFSRALDRPRGSPGRREGDVTDPGSGAVPGRGQ